MKLIFLLVLLFFVSPILMAQSWNTVDTDNTCTERHECAAAGIGEKLYLLGGRGMKPVEEYDPATNNGGRLQFHP